jgi:hypothetical protein
MMHGEFRISYERPLFVGEEVLCRMHLEDSYGKQSRRGVLGFPPSGVPARVPTERVTPA